MGHLSRRDRTGELNNEVNRRRGTIQLPTQRPQDGYRASGGGNAEKQFKTRVETDERRRRPVIRHIEDALGDAASGGGQTARASESKRWQANYDFVLARMELEYAYLFEYQSMLGSMRKEFPPRDASLYGGWKLASQPKLQGDREGKKAAKDAQAAGQASSRKMRVRRGKCWPNARS